MSPYFLSVDTSSDATFNFTERAIVALPLALLIIAGEIDISVAAIIALASGRDGAGARRRAWAPRASSAIGLRHRDCWPAASTARLVDDRPCAVHRRDHRHDDAVSCGAAYAVLG